MAALRCYPSNAILIPRKISSKTQIRASMDSCSSSESKKGSSSVRSTSKVVNKVYEDKNMGILCCTDENGELVCEGLDEGPTLAWQDMEKMSKERKVKTEGDWWQRTLRITDGIDWSSHQTAASMGKK